MKTSFLVPNVKCGGCVNSITKGLSEIENISNLQVDVDKKEVSFEYAQDSDLVAVKDKLSSIGFPPKAD